MPTIKETLEKYEYYGMQDDLAEYLGSMKDSPSVQLLHKIVSHYRGEQAYRPKWVVKAAAAMGITTVEELQSLDTFLKTHSFNPIQLFDTLFPKLNEDIFTKKIHGNELKSLLLKKMPELNVTLPGPVGNTDLKLQLKDDWYWKVPDNQVDYIIDICPSDRFKYILQKRDCEKFSGILRSWLFENGIGNITVGTTAANFYKGNNYIFTHSFICILTENDEILFRDGQDDSIKWKLGQSPDYKNVDRMTIFDMRF